jgi:predicted transcriptional regulator
MRIKLRSDVGDQHEADSDDPIEASRALLSARLDERRTFLLALKDDSTKALSSDKEFFSTMMTLAMREYGVRQSDVAETLSLSKAAVGRWIAGTTAPAQYARNQVIDVVASLLESSLTEPDFETIDAVETSEDITNTKLKAMA